MKNLLSLSPEDLQHYHQVVTHSVTVRSHFDVLTWLQGDMQRYLPHDIMIAAWGDFQTGAIQHDIISAMTGVRTKNANSSTLTPLLLQLFTRWTAYGNKPFSLNAGDTGFLLKDTGKECDLSEALQKMRYTRVHGISDKRGNHTCLYVTLSTQEPFNESESGALAQVLPYIDTALRQIKPISNQIGLESELEDSSLKGFLQEHDLTNRELEVLHWVAMGKTNLEIGLILFISVFTVKNHVKRLFKKLKVSNRAQAVGKFKVFTDHV